MGNYPLHNPARPLRAALCILLLMVALGCSRSGSDIVGTWDNVKAPEVAQFRQDGTGIFLYPKSQNPPLDFRWKRIADNSYYIDVNYLGSPKTLTGTLKDKTLRLESNLGVEMYNKRATN